jgi:uncharacterized integral membrane protein
MEVLIPAKSSGEIIFKYKSNKIIYTFIISLLSYVLIIVFLMYKKLEKC